MAENRETTTEPEIVASVKTDPPPIPSPQAQKTQETPGSSTGPARTRLMLFGISIIMFCGVPILGRDAMGLGIILFLTAGIWHIRADNRSTAMFKQPIEIMPEWSGYSVDEARSLALHAGSSGDEWGRETEAVFVQYAQALAASGMDRETIARKLAETGLTYSGAIDICAQL